MENKEQGTTTRTHQTGFDGERRERSGPRGRGPRPTKRNNDSREVWRPVTNLGRLVKAGSITSIEEIFFHSFGIKEVEIVDHFFSKTKVNGQPEESESTKPLLYDEVMGIKPVQKQSSSGQRTRFKAFVVVGDKNGHVGYGTKCDNEVATAIRGAIIGAKLNIFPVRRGYWGTKIGLPHTVPLKVSGKCASVLCRLIPAPRGTGIVGSPVAKKVLQFAGVYDCFTGTSGHTRTSGNFIGATILALKRTYAVLTPELWPNQEVLQSPLDMFAKVLEKAHKKEEAAN